MRQISLVGAVDEEVGDYFPEFLDMLEESPFLKVRNNLSDMSEFERSCAFGRCSLTAAAVQMVHFSLLFVSGVSYGFGSS